MEKRSNPHRFDEFTVLEVFLGICLFGLISGAVFVGMYPSAPAVPAEVVAPSMDSYQATAMKAMLPFLSATATLTSESDAAPLLATIDAAQQEMFAIRVPAEGRDAHLAAVLLLDRWKRAASTGAAVGDLAERTRALTDSYPWMIGAASAEDLSL